MGREREDDIPREETEENKVFSTGEKRCSQLGEGLISRLTVVSVNPFVFSTCIKKIVYKYLF